MQNTFKWIYLQEKTMAEVVRHLAVECKGMQDADQIIEELSLSADLFVGDMFGLRPMEVISAWNFVPPNIRTMMITDVLAKLPTSWRDIIKEAGPCPASERPSVEKLAHALKNGHDLTPELVAIWNGKMPNYKQRVWVLVELNYRVLGIASVPMDDSLWGFSKHSGELLFKGWGNEGEDTNNA